MLAKDIMTTDVYKVGPAATVEDVARLLAEKHVSGVPVVDDANEVIGIVTEGDLIIKDKKLKVPSAIEILGGIIFLDSVSQFEEDLRRVLGVKVADIMSRRVYAATEDTPIDELANVMIEKEVNRIPIVRERRLVGIVSRADIVRSLTMEQEE